MIISKEEPINAEIEVKTSSEEKTFGSKINPIKIRPKLKAVKVINRRDNLNLKSIQTVAIWYNNNENKHQINQFKSRIT